MLIFTSFSTSSVEVFLFFYDERKQDEGRNTDKARERGLFLKDLRALFDTLLELVLFVECMRFVVCVREGVPDRVVDP
jgi:hypothetical protein